MVETLYTAYYAIGFLAYIVALISYLPFIVSLTRMMWYDSESRRLIFYRNCFRLWMMTLAIDAWIFFNLQVEIDELCEMTNFLPDERKMAKQFKVARFS